MTQDSLSQGLSSFFLMAVFRFHEKYYQLSLVTPCVLPKDVESNEQVLLVVGYKQSQSGGLLVHHRAYETCYCWDVADAVLLLYLAQQITGGHAQLWIC
jgi:hypothetical protein